MILQKKISTNQRIKTSQKKKKGLASAHSLQIQWHDIQSPIKNIIY